MIDGQELAPGDPAPAQAARSSSPEPDLATLSPAESRTCDLQRLALALEGPKLPVARVESLELPGPAGPIGARLYVPEDERPPLPLLVYLHGGGWVRGDLDTHDNTCRFLAREAGVAGAVGRLPARARAPFPAAVEDSFAAFRWAVENAARARRRPGRDRGRRRQRRRQPDRRRRSARPRRTAGQRRRSC